MWYALFVRNRIPDCSFIYIAGYSTIVNMLFDGKADYASSDSTGATPLHYAALNNFAVSSNRDQVQGMFAI
jgi:ankyrin repeat protein